MATTLLTTKLYVPHVLPAFVPRPRITERLSVGMAGKLTLITAPPIETVLTTLINTLSHVSRQIVLSPGI